MRITKVIGVVGLCCVLVAGCASSAHRPSDTYVVQPKDTLYSIAWRHDLDYRDLARWNRIGPDYRIAVGQVLALRPSGGPPPARPPSHARDASPSAPPIKAPGGGAPAIGSAPSVSMHWFWPTEHPQPPRPVPGGGILLLGQIGQVVRAACAGRVVYVGSGLRGYGNLAIIKHGDNLLSAYAHNSELSVSEGQDVAGGQPIGRMGTGPHQVAALYFEIRLNGKPVDALVYLNGVK